MGVHPHRVRDAAVEAVSRLERGADGAGCFVVLDQEQSGHAVTSYVLSMTAILSERSAANRKASPRRTQRTRRKALPRRTRRTRRKPSKNKIKSSNAEDAEDAEDAGK